MSRVFLIFSTLVALFVFCNAQNQTILIGPGFWNVRSSFVLDGIDIGTHMSLIQLKSGRFLVLDTVDLNTELHNEINALTKNGTLIEAIIATHPFHTTYFPVFYQAYPKVPFYGTPRHIKIQPQIPWAGSMYDCANRQRWQPEIHMRIARGSEFEDPQPESSNHFSGIHVFHPVSRTIHVDDTVMVDEPFEGDMLFHPSILGPGLFHITEAPAAFGTWVQKYIDEWDFDTICAAHKGIKLGGAKAELQSLLDESKELLILLADEFGIDPSQSDKVLFQAMQLHENLCVE